MYRQCVSAIHTATCDVPRTLSRIDDIFIFCVLQIPDELTEYYLEKSGMDCKDTRL